MRSLCLCQERSCGLLSSPWPRRAHSSLHPGSQNSILRGLDFKRNGGNPLFDQSSPETAQDSYSFRVFGQVIQILVTSAITENILQFSSVAHGQDILFKDSYVTQSIFFFPFYFPQKETCLESSPLLNTASLESHCPSPNRKSYIQNGRNFAAPETLILQQRGFPLNVGKAVNLKENLSVLCISRERQTASLSLSCSEQQAQALS